MLSMQVSDISFCGATGKISIPFQYVMLCLPEHISCSSSAGNSPLVHQLHFQPMQIIRQQHGPPLIPPVTDQDLPHGDCVSCVYVPCGLSCPHFIESHGQLCSHTSIGCRTPGMSACHSLLTFCSVATGVAVGMAVRLAPTAPVLPLLYCARSVHCLRSDHKPACLLRVLGSCSVLELTNRGCICLQRMMQCCPSQCSSSKSRAA